jgi:hypothetical protein
MANGTIISSRTLRATPAANGDPVADAHAGDVVDTFDTDGDFIKVQLINVPGQPSGWVSKSAVGPAAPANTAIDKELFARACWRDSLFFGVNAHYLAGVAELRSRVTANAIGNQIGPFGLLPEEWAADWKIENLTVDKFPADAINSWRMQSKMFALMTRAAEEEFAKANNDARPSAIDLYLVQIVGTAALKALNGDPNKPLLEIVNGVAPTALPLGNASAAGLVKRHCQLLGVPAANPTGGEVKAQAIAGLSSALATMASFVVGTGASVLQDADSTVTADGLGALNMDSKKIPPNRKPMAQKIVAAFASEGFGGIQQAAALANAIAESGLNPAAASPVTENEASFGLFQCNTRGGGLGSKFTPEQLIDPDTNIRIIINEVKKFPAFGKASTLLDAVTAFVVNVERPADKPGAIATRMGIAQTLIA